MKTFNQSQLIIDVINEYGPIKSTELFIRIIDHLESLKQHSETYQDFEINEIMSMIKGKDLISMIDELVQRKLIIEVEYTLPQMDYRCKSMLFPAGSTIRIIGADDA